MYVRTYACTGSVNAADVLHETPRASNYIHRAETYDWSGSQGHSKRYVRTTMQEQVCKVNNVRQGKYFDIETDETDEKKAKLEVEDMCKKLLANLVIEDFKIL